MAKKSSIEKHLLHKNSRQHPPGGLADDAQLLWQLLEMTAESQGFPHPKDVSVTKEVIDAAAAYDEALWEALEQVVKKYPPKGKATADDLWDAEAPYLVLMTLQGQGVGVWDGRWDEFYKNTDDVEEFLKSKLEKFSDGTGGGKLEDAFSNCAFETGGDPEEDSDDEDEDEDEDEDAGE